MKALAGFLIALGPMILGAAGVGAERMVAVLLAVLLEAIGIGLLVGATVEARSK